MQTFIAVYNNLTALPTSHIPYNRTHAESPHDHSLRNIDQPETIKKANPFMDQPSVFKTLPDGHLFQNNA